MLHFLNSSLRLTHTIRKPDAAMLSGHRITNGAAGVISASQSRKVNFSVTKAGVFCSPILRLAFAIASAALFPALHLLSTNRLLFDTRVAERKRNPMRLCFASAFSRKIHRDWHSFVRMNRCPTYFL